MTTIARKASVMGSIFGTSLLAAALIFLNPSTEIITQAQTAAAGETITEAPIGPTKVLKIKSIDEKSKQTKDKDVDIVMEPKQDGLGIIFKMVNKGSQDKSLGVDGWHVRFQGAIFGFEPVNFSDDEVLKNKSTKVLKELSLENQIELLAEYPGIYSVSLHGYNDKDLLAYQELMDEGLAPEKEQHELASYALVADVIVGFDEAALTRNVIESHNTQVAVTGDGDIFTLTDENTKEVIIMLRNDLDHPVSGNLYAISYNTYNVEHTKAAGSYTLIDTFEGFCKVLQPGETLKVKSVRLDKSKWPLGGDADSALSKKIASESVAVPGKYIVEVDGTTAPCFKDGLKYEAITYGTMLIMEVK